MPFVANFVVDCWYQFCLFPVSSHILLARTRIPASDFGPFKVGTQRSASHALPCIVDVRHRVDRQSKSALTHISASTVREFGKVVLFAVDASGLVFDTAPREP